MNDIFSTIWNSGWPLIAAGFVVIIGTILYQRYKDKFDQRKNDKQAKK